jgi:MATE family multidrug resistance protein
VREEVATHPFLRRPHHTMLVLSLPVLFSLIAEPLTGVADTAFVARLGAGPTAALGVATTLLSSVFWVFNFLGIGTQTAVARAHGATGAAARGASEAVATARAARCWRSSRGRSCTSSRRSWAPAMRFSPTR